MTHAKPPAYLEALADGSQAVEDLNHSNAFEALMRESFVDKRSVLLIDRLPMIVSDLPPELTDNYIFPSKFVVEDFAAQLMHSNEDEDERYAASFDATFTANYVAYRIQTNNLEAKFTVSNESGHEIGFSLPSSHALAAKFLASLAISSIRADVSVIASALPEIREHNNTHVIDAYMRALGGCAGTYQTTTVAVFPDTKLERSVMVTTRETETPSTNGIATEFLLLWSIGGNMTTNTISHQSEAASFGPLPTQLAKRYVTRKPSWLAPDDIEIARLLENEDDHDLKIFDARDSAEAYAAANIAILHVIRPYLADYLNLDGNSELS